MTTIHMTAAQLSAAIAPVLPMAGKDDMLPVLNAVLLETDGKWFIATSTDRFRVGIQRTEKKPTDGDETTEWPTFRALIPLASVKAILALFKPTRHSNPSLSLTIDGDTLIAEGTGGFDLFDSSRFTYHLLAGQYPNVRGMAYEAVSSTANPVTDVGLSTAFLADFKALGPTLRVRMGAAHNKPIIVTNDEGFLGLLMPRRLVDSAEISDDWAEFLAEKPAPKKTAAKKTAAVKASA